MEIENTDLLLVVDVQNDFITGSLAVPNAEDIIPIINKYIKKFKYVLFSKDMHPANHCSFTDQGGLWPPHCVIGTNGADLHIGLRMTGDLFIADKGVLVDKDAYSVFEATPLVRNTPNATGILRDNFDLADHLRLIGTKRLFICGLATDYCVRATVLDATKNEKFDGPVFLLIDAIKAVEVTSGDGDKAIREMIEANVITMTLGTE